MAVGDLLAQDYDFEYNGVLLVGAEGREWIEANVLTSPEIRTSDFARGQLDVEFAGTDYYGGRTFVLTVEVSGETSADFYASYQNLRNAVVLQRTEIPLAFRLPDWPNDLVINCRPRNISGPVLDLDHAFFIGVVQIQFHATDPRVYSLDVFSGSADIQTSTTGLEFDLTFDLTFGGLSVSNTIIANNQGNFEAPWTATITGPVTNPRIEHVEQGKTLAFVGAIDVGETLVVQSKPRANVLLGGTASRYSWLQDSSQWFMLSPGTNSIRFQGSTAGSPSLSLEWRSAWT